ncbi:MAG: hypothetical protein K0S53_3157 [Bacteroidetes bacterium]|nr:hypothetical protein [Bacteroidota bacterium]
MKKVTFTGKLSLNKETIAKLNNEQMSAVKGGGRTDACTLPVGSCVTDATCVEHCSGAGGTCSYTVCTGGC